MAVEPMLSSSGANASADQFHTNEIALRPRDVHFDFTRTPLCWIPGDPYGSHFISSLNLLLPAGERWFCKVFTDGLGYVKDARLREEMIGFMGQEAVHAKSHDKALPDFFLRNGIDSKPFTDQVDWLFGRLDERIGDANPGDQRGAVEASVQIIGGIEHFTAVLGNWVLNCEWDELGADSAMADLFRWHGAEEVEHRHVAHNVANYFHRGYFRRTLASVVGALLFIWIIFRGAKFLVRSDSSLPNLGYPRLIWNFVRSGRRGSIPRLSFLLMSVFRLFKPNYSPEGEGSTAQAVAYLATSPAAREIHG